MTIVESFACGVPVLSAKLGSMPSIIEEGKTGIFFESGQVADLAGKIAWTVTHESDMIAMGQHARLAFKSRYAEDKNLEQLITIYQQAI